MIMQVTFFHDSLNIVLILARDLAFFCVKCDQISLTFTE